MADIFSLIADPTRREILRVLLDAQRSDEAGIGELAVTQLVQATELSQPTVSKHLRVLRDASLVTVREDRQHRYYALDSAPLDEVDEWLMPFFLEPGDLDNAAETVVASGGQLGNRAAGLAASVGKAAADAGARMAGFAARVTPKKRG